MNYLLDTNILIDLLNGHEPARDFLRTLPALNISAITAYEVLAGCSGPRSGQLNVAEMLIGTCNIIPVTPEVAQRAASFQRQQNLKRKMADFLIEATAMEHELTLATRNAKDFSQANTQVPYKI